MSGVESAEINNNYTWLKLALIDIYCHKCGQNERQYFNLVNEVFTYGLTIIKNSMKSHGLK